MRAGKEMRFAYRSIPTNTTHTQVTQKMKEPLESSVPAMWPGGLWEHLHHDLDSSSFSSFTGQLHGDFRDWHFEGSSASFLIANMCLFFLLGSSSQGVVTQEPSLTVFLGWIVTLTCGSSTRALANGHSPYWFQQKPGQVSRTLIYNTDNTHVWTSARFSACLLGSKAALTQGPDRGWYWVQLLAGIQWCTTQ